MKNKNEFDNLVGMSDSISDAYKNKVKFVYDSLPHKESAVKRKLSDRDSSGTQLSKEQADYFRNSKVRDDQENLLVMYHGTSNGGFTKFRSGSYFTQNPDYAALC
ncbi:MAG: hypothetical protein PUD70_02030 [Firmicutes bacterium]|nr:hypothetical protein [Bacillota bacterium]